MSERYQRQCPRCGKVLPPQKSVHWACVRGRLYQVVRGPLLVLLLVVVAALVVWWSSLAPQSQDDTSSAPATTTPAATPTFTPVPTAEVPAAVRVNVASTRLYVEPGGRFDQEISRDTVLDVLELRTVSGEDWYRVVVDTLGGLERWIRASDARPLSEDED